MAGPGFSRHTPLVKTQRMGGLNARLLEGSATGPVVILMHGFGAPGDDLVPLARAMRVPEGTTFVFPEAPNAMPPEYGAGRAWWMIDMQQMQMAMMLGKPRNLAEEYPDELPQVRAQLISLLDALKDKGIASERIVLGGFSQGSMLACDVALHTQRPFAGLVLLSSTLLAEDWWQPKFAARSALPVYQSHGSLDPVLPFPGAIALRDALIGAGLDVQFDEFRGAHEIPMRVLQGASQFITDQFESR